MAIDLQIVLIAAVGILKSVTVKFRSVSESKAAWPRVARGVARCAVSHIDLIKYRPMYR